MSSVAALKTELASVPKRKIGGTDVFPIGYGTMGLSAFYGTVQGEEERLKVWFLFSSYGVAITNSIKQRFSTPYLSPVATIGTVQTSTETLKNCSRNG